MDFNSRIIAVYLYTRPHVIYGNNVTGLSVETFHGIC
jgi:hypothetical protein